MNDRFPIFVGILLVGFIGILLGAVLRGNELKTACLIEKQFEIGGHIYKCEIVK